jgi:hypothetical protein
MTDFMRPGRRKVIGQYIICKNAKRGKVEKIASSDVDVMMWQTLLGILTF